MTRVRVFGVYKGDGAFRCVQHVFDVSDLWMNKTFVWGKGLQAIGGEVG